MSRAQRAAVAWAARPVAACSLHISRLRRQDSASLWGSARLQGVQSNYPLLAPAISAFLPKDGPKFPCLPQAGLDPSSILRPVRSWDGALLHWAGRSSPLACFFAGKLIKTLKKTMKINLPGANMHPSHGRAITPALTCN